MRSNNQRTGASGEAIALEFLVQKGYRLLEKNFRTAYGELDLVMLEGERFIFVEVKTRTSDRFGLPEASVTEKKQETLIACAEAYLAERVPQLIDWQIDVVAIRLLDNGTPQITHFENALPG